jgi:predicted TIM-barrel fold metal-dependent hydrolase
VIDCDVPPPAGPLRDLVPWLDPAFREYVLYGGYGGYALPSSPWGPDSEPDAGLELAGVELGILTAGELLAISAIPNAALAAALATAHNRRLLDEWLPSDERQRGSLLVAPQDAESAAAEIRRLGDRAELVQVLVSLGSQTGYGDPRYRAIWDACAEVGLPLALHAGAEGLGINAAPTSTGYPANRFELRTLLPTTAMSHLVSIVARGVLERVPEARVAIVGAGASWLPPLLDTLDENWRSMRDELRFGEPPSELVRRHVRLTVRPGAGLSATEPIAELLMLGGGGRPAAHWGDGVTSENAREFYGLPSDE